MTTRDATRAAAGSHATDADLVRLLDGEPMLGAGEPVDVHVARCAECDARLGRLRARSAALSSLLAATDPPVPSLDRLRPPAATRARRVPHLRAAAALLLLAAGVAAAATPAVRGWVASRLASRDSVRAGNRATGATPTGGAPAAGAVVRFAPEGQEFVVRFDAAQAGGSLELSAGAGALASAEAVGGREGGESFLVLPNELRVRNGASSVASYRVSLPAGVTAVVVRVGDSTERRVSRATLERAPLSMPLRVK